MRTPALLLLTLLLAAAAAGCGGEESLKRPDRGDPGQMMRHEATMHPDVQRDCPKDELQLVTEGTLTIAINDTLASPWLENEPGRGEGFEDAVATEVARQLGFEPEEVRWVPVSVDEALAPGAGDFDFAIGQLASNSQDTGTNFTRGYYEINQAVVAPDGSSLADASSGADLADATLGVLAGTKAERLLAEAIEINAAPRTFSDLDAAAAALAAGEVDGLVVDLPAALPLAEEVEDAEVVAQFPAIDGLDYFALVAPEESPLVECLNLVLDHLGTTTDWLASEQSWWLSERTEIPFLPLR